MTVKKPSQNKKPFLNLLSKPLFIILTAVALFGFIFQVLLPDPFLQTQESFRNWVFQFEPFDWLIFIFTQIIQVVLAPISHYTIALIGGFIYGPVLGGFYNFTGRMIGHVIAYWIGRKLQSVVLKFFNPDDFKTYKRFIVGTKETLWKRLLILFLMIFLPAFPDDEISYLVGLAGLKFRYYFWVLFFGQLGGSFALAYIGAGQTKDPIFFSLITIGVFFTILLIFWVRKLGKES